MREVLILITTETNQKIAKKIAKNIIESKLAACVSIKNIYSVYKWEDNIEETKEFEITIKTKPEFKDDLFDYLQQMTSYDVPQILYKKFHSESKYHDWLTKTI